MMELRAYQSASVDALFDYWRDGGGNALIVLPTGAGKSLVIAALVQKLLADWPQIRICVVTHTKELITQNFAELLRLWPSAPVGIYSAGVGRYDTRAKILICGVQSAFRRVKEIGGFDVLIVDEAHTIPRASDTMYGKFIEALRDEVPDMRIVGLTATAYRLDSGRLEAGEDAIFDKIVYEAGVVDLIEQGYLSPLISKGSLAEVDASAVRTRGGEFVPGELEDASLAGDLVERAVAELVERGRDRKAWLAFCCGIKHASAVRDALRRQGVVAETVNGQMSAGERDSIIRRFRNGELRCLTSVDVISIGFNVPQVDLVALMRPTLSAGKYVQQVGRGFRCSPGKKNALILDFAGNVRRFGPIDDVFARDRRHRSDDSDERTTIDTVRAKTCPSCESLVAVAAASCPYCGHEWPVTPKHQAVADELPILSTEKKNAPELIPVVSWEAKRWPKAGSPDSVRVTYFAGLQSYSEWLFPEHRGPAHEKSRLWWQRHRGGELPPTATDVLLYFPDRGLTMPTHIAVKRDPTGKWWNIVSRQFAERKEAAA